MSITDEIREIKDRQIQIDANAHLNIKPDNWDHRNAYIDRRNLLRWYDELLAENAALRGE